jgi:hypothetical protein
LWVPETVERVYRKKNVSVTNGWDDYKSGRKEERSFFTMLTVSVAEVRQDQLGSCPGSDDKGPHQKYFKPLLYISNHN